MDLQPWKQDISNIAFWIVQQSRQISISGSTQQASQLLVPPIDMLGYNQLAQTHACVQSALTSFQAYIQYQTSKTVAVKELYLSQSCLVLTKLQNEVNNFSLGNADAIVIASLILAAQAQDWEQWVVFMEGYSSALKQIKQHTTQTIYPDLLGDPFPPQHNPPPTTIPTIPPPRNLEAMHHQIQTILTAIRATNPLISTETWHHTGFQDLEQLALTLTDALQLQYPLEI
ncbi:hypothetical protein HYALB_00005460 [Hymenoscyphus albidus]|uniref:Uncharacterized protein n=1 Tax=Hymenoscyphus albidus TaxID=595503 RepID=A0A9N9M1P4_9HELO|nr:hypothetical protein HYALB_00005460 [Hymenoscyphus albidus]